MNLSKRTIEFIFIIMLSLLFLTNGTASGKDKIVWPYVCYKPVYVCSSESLTGGSGYHIIRLLWENLPEYNHEFVQMPIKRILEFSKEKHNQLFYGLYKTAERESFLYFSIPCRISTPTYLVIRNKDRTRFDSHRQASLQALLKDPSLTFLYLKSISFGKGIDGLLETYKDRPNVLTEYDTTNMSIKSLKLLVNKRVDYMLSLDGTGYDAKAMGLENEIAFLSIQEQNKYEVGYITAPKNSWGERMIRQVNKILKKEIQKPAFFEYFKPLVDETMWPELKHQFNNHILAPAQQWTPIH